MPGGFQGAIFDVDGVLIGSPHQRASREALPELMGGERRGPGEGRFVAFAHALRFILAVKRTGMRVATVWSSRNVRTFLDRIRLDIFAAEQRLDYPFIGPGLTLLQLFAADLRRFDQPHGTPDSMTFLAAAAELDVGPPSRCLVVACAPAAIVAARSGGMAALGVPRLGEEGSLQAAGADLVVAALDDVSVAALGEGRLRLHSAFAERSRRRGERPPSTWSLAYEGFDPERQGLREALCALATGSS